MNKDDNFDTTWSKSVGARREGQVPLSNTTLHQTHNRLKYKLINVALLSSSSVEQNLELFQFVLFGHGV